MSTNEIPFLLTYRTEVMIPNDIGYPSHQVAHYTLESNEQGLGRILTF